MQSENIINTLNKSLTSDSDDQGFNDFTVRLQTYIDGQKWVRKPLSLSPPVCAQYGWKCGKTDLLECVACGAKLSVCESNIGNFDSYKACIEKTLSNLKDNHGKHCPWPLTPSPENIVRMILMPKEEAMSQFLKRVASSLPFQSSFPKIKESVVTDLGFDAQHIQSLCKMAGIKAEDACRFGKSIVSLSATGWVIAKEEESSKSVLKCGNCLRSVWCRSFSLHNLENSQSKADESCVSENINGTNLVLQNGVCKDNTNDKQTSEEPPAKKKRISLVIKSGEPFDPLYEHRPWCLWIHEGVDSYTSASSDDSIKVSKNPSSLPGWKIFVKSLLRNITDSHTLEVKDSPSKEQIRNVKNLLEKWTDEV